jgi:hypothetical protein
MTEYQRIEQLADKLCHPILDIRHRAVQNLLSKLQSGMIEKSIMNSASCAESIAKGVSKCLHMVYIELPSSDVADVAKGVLLLILKLMKHIGRQSVGSPLVTETYSHVLDSLYKLSTSDQLDDSTRQKIKEVRRVRVTI